MPALELLDSGIHATLGIRPVDQSQTTFVRVILEEIGHAASACPLLLSKHADTGAFYIGALMGFKEGETLIDRPDGVPAFRPMEWERAGFFASGENMAIDQSHPRFAVGGGDPLFEADGKPAAALKVAQKALGHLMAGAGATEAFVTALVAHRLIEPMDITLRFDDGERLRLEGLYTVSLDALARLNDAAVIELFRTGYLQASYIMAASLHHIALMARRRNERLAAG